MKDYRIALLADYYGALLQPRALEAVRKYYDEDLSLTEIAAATGVTKQAVSDTIARASAQLSAFEDKLHMLRVHDEACRAIDACIDSAPTDPKATIERLRRLKTLI